MKCPHDQQELTQAIDANHRPVLVHGWSSKQTWLVVGAIFTTGALFMLMVLRNRI